jgi:hypothetical protein
VFETAHGIGENIRGRTLGAIDDVTKSGSDESRSLHASLVDRGRLEAETGMAHISGYADPDVYRDELARTSNSSARTFGNGHTPGRGPGRDYVRVEEDDYDGRNGRVDGGVERGHGTNDGYDRTGVRGFEQQNSAIDPNPQRGDLSPNRGPQNAGSEAGWTSMSQAGSLTPTQQTMKRDFPPELPPRPQTQAADNNHHGH